MVVSEMHIFGMRGDIEEFIREGLEANRAISDAARDACFRST